MPRLESSLSPLVFCHRIDLTSHSWEHQGSLVATSRIKWFLGETTRIYAPSDIPSWIQRPQFTVGQLVGDLYGHAKLRSARRQDSG